jgi:hypothetical protein
VFATPDELFNFLAEEWSKSRSEVIERHWSSFHGRIQVCAAHGGACHSGHWEEIDHFHHPDEREQEQEAIEQSHEEEEDKLE